MFKFKFKFLALFLFLTIFTYGQSTFISEIHYADTSRGDDNDGIELTGPSGTELDGWRIEVFTTFIIFTYLEDTIDLSGERLNGTGSYGSAWFNIPLPNGLATIVLIDNNDEVVQLLSYGLFTLTPNSGPADGMASKNIDVMESTGRGWLGGRTGTNPKESLQLTENGEWIAAGESKGDINPGLTLSVVKNDIEGFAMYPNPVSDGHLKFTSNSWADKQVQIYSISGQQVYNKLVKQNEVLDIYNLNKGIYLVRIEEDNKIATRKLVVN